MLSRSDIRAILQNVVAWALSLVIASATFLLWPQLGSSTRYLYQVSGTLGQIVACVAIFLCVLVTLLVLLGRRLTRVQTFLGREEVMQRNVNFVRRLCRSDDDDFLSTRVTYWDLAESSTPRVLFRSLLTEKICAGFLVKRLWHLSSEDDVARLRVYLEQYQRFDNYHVRVLRHLDCPIPELICIGLRGASITFPDIRSPRRASVCIQFRRRAEVDAIRRYFDLLWESAAKVKTGAAIEWNEVRLKESS